jgi:hypothetical protein
MIVELVLRDALTQIVVGLALAVPLLILSPLSLAPPARHCADARSRRERSRSQGNTARLSPKFEVPDFGHYRDRRYGVVDLGSASEVPRKHQEFLKRLP